MKLTNPKQHYNIAAAVHLSTFGKWLFPLGNFIFPIVLWIVNGKKSEFIDSHGRSVLNFQLSITLYTILLAFIGGGIIIGTMVSGGPVFWDHMDTGNFFAEDLGIISTIAASGFFCGVAILGLAIMDLVCTIQGAIKASDGKHYRYPLTIHFIPGQIVAQPSKKN